MSDRLTEADRARLLAKALAAADHDTSDGDWADLLVRALDECAAMERELVEARKLAGVSGMMATAAMDERDEYKRVSETIAETTTAAFRLACDRLEVERDAADARAEKAEAELAEAKTYAERYRDLLADERATSVPQRAWSYCPFCGRAGARDIQAHEPGCPGKDLRRPAMQSLPWEAEDE